MKLSKTDYLQFLECPKSLWLMKNKPDLYPASKSSPYEDKLAKEGYEVQKIVQDLVKHRHKTDKVSFEKPFSTKSGLYAVADIIVEKNSGELDIYEVKSASSVEKTHLFDATFQSIAVKETGKKIESIFIVHLNKEYVRGDELEVDKMVTFSNVSNRVETLVKQTRNNIERALRLIDQKKISEEQCTCLLLSKSHHCQSFKYFNRNITIPSIYNLPRIHKNKIKKFVSESRFSLNSVEYDEVSERQQLVLKAAKDKTPVINLEYIKKFYKRIKFPLFFLDYETYSSAIPIIKGAKPHAHLPFQFSVHKQMTPNSGIEHFEYLAESAELPEKFLSELEKVIGEKGTVISWHKSFENTRNKEMGDLFPEKKDFLLKLIKRTIDLENIFKMGYVDINFMGSTSIKKVLPVIVPSLTYEGMAVANGTDAMIAFAKMISLESKDKRKKLRNEMLEYCKLDTLAMVKIYEKIKKIFLA